MDGIASVEKRGKRCATQWGEAGGIGTNTDVIAAPPGKHFSATNDNSVAILLAYGTASVLLAGNTEARKGAYMASGTFTSP